MCVRLSFSSFAFAVHQTGNLSSRHTHICWAESEWRVAHRRTAFRLALSGPQLKKVTRERRETDRKEKRRYLQMKNGFDDGKK